MVTRMARVRDVLPIPHVIRAAHHEANDSTDDEEEEVYLDPHLYVVDDSGSDKESDDDRSDVYGSCSSDDSEFDTPPSDAVAKTPLNLNTPAPKRPRQSPCLDAASPKKRRIEFDAASPMGKENSSSEALSTSYGSPRPPAIRLAKMEDLLIPTKVSNCRQDRDRGVEVILDTHVYVVDDEDLVCIDSDDDVRCLN